MRLKEYFSYGLLPSSPDGLATAPLFVTCVASVPLFVTCSDISPRRGENLSRPGEVFPLRGLLLQNRIAFPLMVKKLPLSGELPSECEAERVHNIKENNKL